MDVPGHDFLAHAGFAEDEHGCVGYAHPQGLFEGGPQALADEVARYNAFVEAGADDDFGKLLAGCPKIEDGPFYAVAINGLPYTTYGGIAVDVDGHVLTAGGGTIPALYAAGLCTGSFAEQAGVFYLGGMAQALAFGRQVGKNAAAETAWL